MSLRLRTAMVAAATPALAWGVLSMPASASTTPTPTASPLSQAWVAGHTHSARVCATGGKGSAACNAEVLLDNATGRRVSPFAVSGKTPSDIRSAYGLTGSSSGGRTVAIVDAYGYPNAERDLGVYRSTFGLPACTKANGCLRIINQSGGTTAPKTNVGWDQEQALDLDAVSAACPDCRIVLVQATSSSLTNLGKAENTAAAQAGVVAISNSYGGGDLSDRSYGSYYNHPGIAVTASTGDGGYAGASYPASSRYVVAVGGTSLTADTGTARGWTERAWSGAGSGCTTSNAAPTGQSSSVTHCSGRAIADISAVADPATGLAVYAPTSSTKSSWAQYGGTSLSSPIVASVFAQSGQTSGYPSSYLYAATSGLNDVTSGSNGSCSYWCTAQVGWDGPTGLGTPNGTSAF